MLYSIHAYVGECFTDRSVKCLNRQGIQVLSAINFDSEFFSAEIAKQGLCNM